MLNQIAVDYLTKRGLDPDLAGARGLHSASKPDGKFQGDDNSQLLGIPYYVDDQAVFFKYRKLWELKENEDGWLAAKGGQLVFWNRAAITDPGLVKEPLIITEGEWDALAAIEGSCPRVVSVPNGATEKGEADSLNYVSEASAALDDVESIIIATDGDRAGDALAAKLLKRLGRARCRRVEYPFDAKGSSRRCKDLNEVLQRWGKDAVKKVIERAPHVPMDGLYTLDQLPEERRTQVTKVQSLGPDIESHLGFCRGHLGFFTGEPGGGKTTLLRSISWALAVEHNWKTCAAFFEDKPRHDTVRKLKKLYANGWPEESRMRESEEWIREHYLWIIKKGYRELPTVDWFLDQAEAAVIRNGCSFVIADPWSQFSIKPRRGEDKLDAILEGILSLKRFAETMNVFVAVIAHPKKHNEWGGTTKMADGDAIAGSKDFRARCDLGVTVQADPRAKFLTNVKVWKVRDREEQGDIGEFALRLSAASNRFSPLHPDDAAALREANTTNVVQMAGRQQRKDIYE